MRYAEAGYNLEVDLSRGYTEKVENDPKLTELHLGGQGINAKIIFDRVGPEVAPFSPDNLLIFGAGLLNATQVVGANRTVVNTISPQTGLFTNALMGGWFGAELKYAGYDRIIIRGKAPDLVYLWINNDKVEIRDASHLRGKGVTETAGIIKQELKEPNAKVAAIGLAGENRVYTASIGHNWSSASRGVGPVMGDKRLKAIAVRGTKDVNIAYPAELWQLTMRMRREIHDNDDIGERMAIDEDDSFHHNMFGWGNARTRIPDYWSKELQDRWYNIKYDNMERQIGCHNCPKNCINVISYQGRKRFGYKCFGKVGYHLAAFKELDFSYEIVGVAQEYGMDAYSTPQVIAFGIELYDAGILTDKDLPDFPADPGERTWYLLEKIVRREGVGDVLANGVYWAARQIGNGAEAYDHNTMKKIEQVPVKLYKLNPMYFLMYATGEKATITQIEGSFPQGPLPTREEREEFVRNWVAAPDERYKKWFVEWDKRHDISIEAACAIAEWNEAMHYIDDSTGICAWLSSFNGQFYGQIPYHINSLPHIITLASGIELDKDKLWKIYQRTRNLVRAINVRRGMRRKDERPPEDHWVIRNEEYEQKLLSGYYEFRGWTMDGIPTKETLDNLGLNYVSEDLIRRGILTESEGTGGLAVSSEPAGKKGKNIKVNLDKCNGCGACEMVCSAYHAKPKYSSINPARSRIQVDRDPVNDEYVLARAANYVKAACVDRCTGLLFKCGMCGNEKDPLCVQACTRGCLTYEKGSSIKY